MRTIFRAPGSRLSLAELVARAFPGLEVSALEKLVDSGAISIAGGPARKLKTRVQPGCLVEVRSPAQVPLCEASGPWRVLVPAFPWRAGRLEARRGPGRGRAGEVGFERVDERDGVADLLVSGAADDVRVALADAGHPLLGDTEHAGILVAGGLRLVSSEGGPPSLWWPEEPVFPGKRSDEAPLLEVSEATRRILSRGHPWVLRDDETGDPSRFAAGTRVVMAGPAGEALGVAHVEGSGRLTARVWVALGADDASVEARVAAALKRRNALLDAKQTDAYRLVHGEADRLPGLFVDRLGPLLRVLVTSAGTRTYRRRALDAVVGGLETRLGGNPLVIEVLHLRDRPAGELECTRVMRGDASSLESKLIVHEAGVRYRVDLGLERPQRASPGVGLYLDQRDNRERLLASTNGGRLLNLFAHTGAFSVAWLAAGRGQAVSVDLSAAYLRWLEENLRLNGLDASRHSSVKQDSRRFLEALGPDERFDAIVLDPPTAAAAGRRFWSIAKELPSLVACALRHLSPGGALLVSRNDRRRAQLRELVLQAAKKNAVSLVDVRRAGPGIDFPRLSGFPDGDPFSAVIARRSPG
jgi:23S rRNA (cytosine1962-C5)-methyltransferase